MRVRPMVPADLEPVALIEQSYPSPWTAGQIVAELQIVGSVVLVIEDSGIVLGWCCCRVMTDEGELLKVAVHPERRGGGLGGALLAAAEKVLVTAGVVRLYLEVRSRNLSAVRFYIQHGFGEIGRRPKYYCDPVDDALIMSKKLVLQIRSKGQQGAIIDSADTV